MTTTRATRRRRVHLPTAEPTIRSQSRVGGQALAVLAAAGLLFGGFVIVARPARGEVTQAEVQRAIEGGIRFLKQLQRADGSWVELELAALSSAG